MKVDEKCARQLAEELLHGYLERLVEEKLIKSFKFEFKEDSPLFTIVCNFDYHDKRGRHKRQVHSKKELYFKIPFTVSKEGSKPPPGPLYASFNTSLTSFRNKILYKIRERNDAHALEVRVLNILQKLKQQDHKFGVCRVFESSEQTDNELKLDNVFSVEIKMPAIFFREGRETYQLGFNVKSSKEGQDYHKRKHPSKPSLYAEHYYTDEQIEKSIEKMINHSVVFLLSQFMSEMVRLNQSEYNFYLTLDQIVLKSMNGMHQ